MYCNKLLCVVTLECLLNRVINDQVVSIHRDLLNTSPLLDSSFVLPVIGQDISLTYIMQEFGVS